MSKNMTEEMEARIPKFADESFRKVLGLHHRHSGDKAARDYREWFEETFPEDPDAELMEEIAGLLDAIHDKLQSMLPPPVPTLEEAASLWKQMEAYWCETAVGQLQADDSPTDEWMKGIADYFDDAIKQQAAEGEGGK